MSENYSPANPTDPTDPANRAGDADWNRPNYQLAQGAPRSTYVPVSPQPQYYAAPTPEIRPVNKVIYIVLAFFLGEFGIHKFYAGKNTLGVLYLVFFWTLIPGLIGVIEAIIALFRPADQYGNIYV